MSQSREELVTQIIAKQIGGCYNDLHRKKAELIADFIIADRKRVVEPLVKFYEKISEDEDIDTFEQHDLVCEAIDETLKNSGVEI